MIRPIESDRKAAYRYWHVCGGPDNDAGPEPFTSGSLDRTDLVQAFAEYRLELRASPDEAVARLNGRMGVQ
jgi:hypothetical protein